MTGGPARQAQRARGARRARGVGRLAVVPLLGLLLLAFGCGGAAGAGDRTLTVFAAASLTETFEEIAAEFEQAHPGVEVRLSFAGSSDLVAQVRQGAPADVVATADEANMDKLVGADLVGQPQVFATNVLQLAVPPGNPAGIGSLADLTPDDALVVCAPVVPCGAAAVRVADAAGVELTPVSEEGSVTDVLGKVVSGEADAGLVYVTDVRGAGDDVEGIPLAQAGAAVNRYPIATVAGSEQAELAREFVDLVLSPTGQDVLVDAGFGRP